MFTDCNKYVTIMLGVNMEDRQEYIDREKLLMDLEYRLIEQFISIRKDNHITQDELSKMSKVIRQTINRIENYITSPGVNTMIKLLEPLGYTLKIVPLNDKGDE